MQLKKLSPLAGLILTGLLSACGGGGDEPPPPAAPPPPPGITVSALSLNSTTPKPYATDALQFDGGVCSGGTGTLTAAWDFGDGNGSGAYAPHTYLDSVAGTHTVTVTCTDTAGTAAGVATLQLNVLSAAMKGFLGRSWTSYAALETNVSPYPVAGIATSGDIYGVWIRRNAGGTNEVATGQTAFNQNNWTVASTILNTTTDLSPFVDFQNANSGATAPIDIAVSPDGHALAAWMAGSSIYYATKSATNSAWSTPAKITVPIIFAPVKVVINDTGNGAIGYCTSSGAFVIPYFNNTAGAPEQISARCGVLDSFLTNNTPNAFHAHRAFDVAIDGASKLVVVGISVATSGPGKTAVAVKTYTAGAWSSLSRIADEIATVPESLSLSLSPNGTHGAIAWSQIDPTITPAPPANVFTSMWNGINWSAGVAFNHDITPTTTYDRPLVAVNNSGDAFMTMRLANATGKVISATNYNASATLPQWSKEVAIDGVSGGGEYRAMDIAIDTWGTGLVTQAESNFRYSQAGTFAKNPGVSQWSGMKIISSAHPDTVYYSSQGYHYQTMRALPDGRAILVTSLYDQRPDSSARISSGYMMLK
jgi:hypothetical protein